MRRLREGREGREGRVAKLPNHLKFTHRGTEKILAERLRHDKLTNNALG